MKWKSYKILLQYKIMKKYIYLGVTSNFHLSTSANFLEFFFVRLGEISCDFLGCASAKIFFGIFAVQSQQNSSRYYRIFLCKIFWEFSAMCVRRIWDLWDTSQRNFSKFYLLCLFDFFFGIFSSVHWRNLSDGSWWIFSEFIGCVLAKFASISSCMFSLGFSQTFAICISAECIQIFFEVPWRIF